MNVDTIVKDVKGRVEPYVAKGQEVVSVSVDTLKQANSVVVDGVQSLVKTQVEAGKDLLAAVQTSFNKVKADGIKAVAAAPIEYLPDGRERVLSAYNDSVTVVTKAGDQVAKIVKKGFSTVSGTLSGRAAAKVKAKTTQAKTTVRKTVRKATAKKSAA